MAARKFISSRRIDLIGHVSGRLTVVRETEKRVNKKIVWECLCECGRTSFVLSSALISRRTKSCGCLQMDTVVTHGESGTKEYRAWKSMTIRCGNPLDHSYHRYGGRGISVCERWRNYDAFLADMGRCPKGLTLDRVDNNKDYDPSNCRWATAKQQGRNRSTNRIITVDGLSLCIADWADRLGLSAAIIHDRRRLGWSDEKAVTTPLLRHRTKASVEDAQ